MLYEYSINGNWFELLSLIAPKVTRAAVLRYAETRIGIGQFAAIPAVASPYKVKPTR